MKNLCQILMFFLAFQGIATAQLFQAWPSNESFEYLFVNTSDIFDADWEATSSILPNMHQIGIEKATEIELTDNYRDNLLKHSGIQESDFIFIKDLHTGKEYSFQINNLKAMAVLSVYTSEQDWPYLPYNYHYGFVIKSQKVPHMVDNFSELLATVGSQSDFEKGALEKIEWNLLNATTKAEVSKIPQNTEFYTEFDLPPFNVGQQYTYNNGDCLYYLIDLNDVKTQETFARHLYVYDQKQNVLLTDRFFQESEGISLAPIMLKGVKEENPYYQLTGKLLKNAPPIITGFTFHSFDCPTLIPLDMAADDIIINCDNRH